MTASTMAEITSPETAGTSSRDVSFAAVPQSQRVRQGRVQKPSSGLFLACAWRGTAHRLARELGADRTVQVAGVELLCTSDDSRSEDAIRAPREDRVSSWVG